ncbi:MAG: hypothetical protein H6714_04100 [Myxococcales bacterium]|nr:hypothetical protein [Myxococcales bacterium]
MIMQDSITRLARVSSAWVNARAALSAVLMGYFAFQLWELWAGFDGPEGFADRFNDIPRMARLFVLVMGLFVPYLLYTYAGLRQMWRGDDIAASQYGSRGLRRLQRFWGLAVFVWIAVHLFHVWLPNLNNPLLAEGVFDALYRDASKPFYLVVYVTGMSAATFQWAQGVATYGVLRGWVSSDRWRRRWRAAALVSSGLLWLLGCEVLGYFVTGARPSIELLGWLDSLLMIFKHWMT